MESFDQRVLQNPINGGRREAEWDDHSEAYPVDWDGPHVFVDFALPKGWFLVSAYFFNKDAHDAAGLNSLRDYTLSISPFAGSGDDQRGLSPVASCRVQDFRGGVYKRFLVRGPGSYTMKLAREGSYSTIIPGLFFDQADGKSGAFVDDLHKSDPSVHPAEAPQGSATAQYEASRREESNLCSQPATVETVNALSTLYYARLRQLYQQLCAVRPINPPWSFLEGRKVLVHLTQQLDLLAKSAPGTDGSLNAQCLLMRCLDDAGEHNEADTVSAEYGRHLARVLAGSSDRHEAAEQLRIVATRLATDGHADRADRLFNRHIDDILGWKK
jgi:hypothetical protein